MTLDEALEASIFGYAKKPYNGTFLYYTERHQFLYQRGHLIPTDKHQIELHALDWEPVTYDG